MSTLVPTEVSTSVPPTSGTSCSGSTPGHHTLASSHSLVSTTISGYNSVPGTSVSGSSVNSLINPVIKTEIEDDIDMPEYQGIIHILRKHFYGRGRVVKVTKFRNVFLVSSIEDTKKTLRN